MQANLETLGSLERKLSIAVPMAEIDSEVESRLKQLTRTVKMAGFRPGKVPFKVVAQQYGPQVRQEVLGDTLQKTFGDAVNDNQGVARGVRSGRQKRASKQVARHPAGQGSCCSATVAELVDAPDLGSGAERRVGSSPSFRTRPPLITNLQGMI